MNEDEFRARTIELLLQEADDPEQSGIWWLSFCSEDGFLGAILTSAPGFVHALEMSHARKLNPGGEVQGLKLPEGTAVCVAALAKYSNRLLTRDECEQFELALCDERERLMN